MTEHKLGDKPIEEKHLEGLNNLARYLDVKFNGDAHGKDRKVGFVLLVFNYNDEQKGHCNFISNGADRRDVVNLFKEMIARFEGQPEMEGHA